MAVREMIVRFLTKHEAELIAEGTRPLVKRLSEREIRAGQRDASVFIALGSSFSTEGDRKRAQLAFCQATRILIETLGISFPQERDDNL